MVWIDELSNYAQEGDIYAQIHSNNGSVKVPQFKAASSGRKPKIVAFEGGFVITWYNSTSLYACLFHLNGTANGNCFQVDTISSVSTFHYCLTMLKTITQEQFVIAYYEGNYAISQRFDTSGMPLGDPVVISNSPTYFMENLSVYRWMLCSSICCRFY